MTEKVIARLAVAAGILRNHRRPSYRVRLDIERAVVRALELRSKEPQLDTPSFGEVGFRAIELLREIASFDPYVVAGDSTSEAAPRPPLAVVNLHGAICSMLNAVQDLNEHS